MLLGGWGGYDTEKVCTSCTTDDVTHHSPPAGRLAGPAVHRQRTPGPLLWGKRPAGVDLQLLPGRTAPGPAAEEGE